MVGEQAGGIGPERILNRMDRPSLTKARAAHATGASRRMLNYYLSGAKPIPKTVWLACLGWETAGVDRESCEVQHPKRALAHMQIT